MASPVEHYPGDEPQVPARTVRQFVHQLRSHLTAIGPAAEYMAGPDVPPEVRSEMVQIVIQSVGRIEHLLADLSVVAAPERARPGAHARSVDLPALVRSVLLRYTDHAQSVGAWLVLDVPKQCAPVLGHPTVLEQAVDNALLVVLQLARRGDRVVAQLVDSDGPNRELELTVALRPGEGGQRCCDKLQDLTGVALAAAQIIAEEHGGSLSPLPEGIGVVLRLPTAPMPPLSVAAAGSRALDWLPPTQAT